MMMGLLHTWAWCMQPFKLSGTIQAPVPVSPQPPSGCSDPTIIATAHQLNPQTADQASNPCPTAHGAPVLLSIHPARAPPHKRSTLAAWTRGLFFASCSRPAVL